MALATAVGLGYAGYRILATLRRGPSDEAESVGERLVRALVEVDDDPGAFLSNDEEGGGAAGHRVRPGAMLRCAVATALLIRSEYSAPARTEANRLVVESMATKLLRLRNVRKTDIARMLPLVVLAVFTPSEDDILFRQVAGSTAVISAVERGERRYTSGSVAVWLSRFWYNVPEALEFAK